MTCEACRGEGCPTCDPSPFPACCDDCWLREEGVCAGEPDTDGSCPRLRELEFEAAQDAHDRQQEDLYWNSVKDGD